MYVLIVVIHHQDYTGAVQANRRANQSRAFAATVSGRIYADISRSDFGN
jgi:hypothetical protein